MIEYILGGLVTWVGFTGFLVLIYNDETKLKLRTVMQIGLAVAIFITTVAVLLYINC